MRTLGEIMESRNQKMSGKEEIVNCRDGKYKVVWNKDGYPIKAVKENV